MNKEESLLPVRAVNAWTFCPRLFWLEHVEGVFLENAHTLAGSHVHRRVDVPGGRLKAPGATEEDPPWHARSLWLSSEALGVSGKLDLAEEDGGAVLPVDTKKGAPPSGGGLWPADQIQLTLQALLLREQGYRVDSIAAYYNETRRRVRAPMTPALEAEALAAVAGARRTAEGEGPPPPLIDSPKCRGCSLAPACLPDELSALMASGQTIGADGIRRIQAPRDDATPVYVDGYGARVSVRKGCLALKGREGGEAEEIGLPRVSQLNLMGGVQITTQAIQACLGADVPVAFFSGRGWFYGRTIGMGSRQVHVRRAQFKAEGGPQALAIARVLIADKLANSRTLLRRNGGNKEEGGEDGALAKALRRLSRSEGAARKADEAATLLGIEGDGARVYWERFSALLARDEAAFGMEGRNRRPPRDPSNALLSFGYALLVKDCTLAVQGAGLDAFMGIYHTAHHGRPSLSLDLMEPFRPLIVDSVVLQMIRRKEAQVEDFIRTGQGVMMKPRVRGALIEAYERRMDELITHPVFGYRVSYRRVLAVQARLMARVLMGELDAMPSFRTR